MSKELPMIIAGSILKMSFLYPLRNVYMYEYCQCGGCLLISKRGSWERNPFNSRKIHFVHCMLACRLAVQALNNNT